MVTNSNGLTDTTTSQVTVALADNQLQNGVAVTDLSASANQEIHYFVNVPARTQQLRINLSGGNGE